MIDNSKLDPAKSFTPAASPLRWRRWRRPLLWGALVSLLLVAQSLLVGLTLSYEAARAQEQVEQAVTEVAARAKQLGGRELQGLQSLLWESAQAPRWHADASELLRRARSLLRIEYRDANRSVVAAED